jgi:hypothetical protein
MSAGRSRRSSPAIGSATSAAPPTTAIAQRQPRVARCAISGRKTSWPVEFAAVSRPTTSPRRAANQRVAIIAASTGATAPVAAPVTSPHSRYKCHGCDASGVSAAEAAISPSATVTTRRRPIRSTSAAENGPLSPNTTRLIETATAIVARLQPNSSCNGTITTPGTARNAAEASSAAKPAPATTQA